MLLIHVSLLPGMRASFMMCGLLSTGGPLRSLFFAGHAWALRK